MKDQNQQKIKKELKDIIQREKNRLELKKSSLEAQIEEINKRIEQVPFLEKKLAAIKDELDHLNFLKKERINKQKELHLLNHQIKKASMANLKIEKEGKILATKIELLSKSNLICPICARKLTNPYKGMLLGEFKKVYLQKKEDYQNNLKIIKNNKKRMKFLEDKLREIDIILLGKEELESQKKKIINDLEKTKRDSRKLNQLYEQKIYLDKTINKKTFAPLTQKILKNIEEDNSD